MNRVIGISLVIIITLLVFGLSSPKGNDLSDLRNRDNGEVEGTTEDLTLYQVVEVVDGDTIKVKIKNKVETIRLIGINTPETNDPIKKLECFGNEAKDKSREVLLGQKVRLQNDPTQDNRDKYKRLLRYVFLEDGTNFNKLMIEQGFAYEYTYDIPYKYQTEFKKAQMDAERTKTGLWSGVCDAEIEDKRTFKNSYICDCSKTCAELSCEEANFQFKECGCSERDGDGDGLACNSLCKI